MKDFFGNELNVGDSVAFIHPRTGITEKGQKYHRHLVKGIIVKIGKKMAHIKCHHEPEYEWMSWETIEKSYPDSIIKEKI